MDFKDREKLKEVGRGLIVTGATAEIRAEGQLMVLTAHFYRNPKAPSFEVYASNWLAASRQEIDPGALALLEPRFPICKTRMIKTGYSDWGSYGNPRYR